MESVSWRWRKKVEEGRKCEGEVSETAIPNREGRGLEHNTSGRNDHSPKKMFNECKLPFLRNEYRIMSN